MKYRKKPVVVEATQWFRSGDHSNVETFSSSKPADLPCKYCGRQMIDHGWIGTLEGGHIVCPGDWIITGTANETYPCKPDIFATIYEPASEDAA